MDIKENYFLKEHLNDMIITSITMEDLTKENNIPFNSYKTFINWETINHVFEIFFDFENNEQIVRMALEKSKISLSEDLYIYLDCDVPLLQVKQSFFFNNWEDFYACNGYTGFVVVSKDTNYILEFTENGKLYSNFIIALT